MGSGCLGMSVFVEQHVEWAPNWPEHISRDFCGETGVETRQNLKSFKLNWNFGFDNVLQVYIA